MFTGIIDKLGVLQQYRVRDQSAEAIISFKDEALEKVQLGESIAVNGVCLTVTNSDSQSIAFDISSETLQLTTASGWRRGDVVNLERAVTLHNLMGGHLVSGHIDGKAEILSMQPQQDYCQIQLRVPEAFTRYIVQKGSIALDGISLTINNVTEECVTVMIVPHTLKNTNLQQLKIGDFVNFEVDQIARYIEKLILHKTEHSF